MVDTETRRSWLDRIVALNGGDDDLRALYAVFTDADLQAALIDAEEAALQRGTLDAKWRAVGDLIITAAPAQTAAE